ncbi:hypothetical protein CW304_06575 [Bacillus sp. UFRGS-B20]|nr:hypothetical protein CW304_06575 [Bacillus sp. UFRGS-B20]
MDCVFKLDEVVREFFKWTTICYFCNSLLINIRFRLMKKKCFVCSQNIHLKAIYFNASITFLNHFCIHFLNNLFNETVLLYIIT